MKYRRKSSVIEAYQTNVEHEIETPNGTVTAYPGDWVALDSRGHWYPIAEDVFEDTYELVEDATDETK